MHSYRQNPGHADDAQEARRRSAPRRVQDGVAAAAAGLAHPLTPETVLALQRVIGNAAVARLVEQRRHARNETHGEMHERTDLAAADTSAEVQRSTVHQVLRSPGQQLAEPVRTEMETRLGADFTGVRIHDDAAAQRSATDIGARAYTSGNHVVIGQGGADMHTLAHELTHVIQQRQGPVAGTDCGDGVRVSDPGDRFERAAEANARAVMSGPSDAVVQRTSQAQSRPSHTSAGTPVGTPNGAVPPVIQRSISIGGTAMEWKDVRQRLALDPEFARFINGEKLDFVLRHLDSINYKCHTTSQLFGAVNNLHRQLDKFAVDSVNPETWAVFHRLRGGATGQGFDDFLKGRASSEGAVADQKKEYAAKGAKYDPASHTWDTNAEWLEKVGERKVVLTDIPLKKSNIMRKLTATGERAKDHERSHDGQVSAYAREIAFALARGYVPLWHDHLKPGADKKAAGLPVYVLVPPEAVKDMPHGSAPRFVDERSMAGIADRGTVGDDGSQLLLAFHLAGLPTNLEISPEEHGALLKKRHEERADTLERQRHMEDVRRNKEEKSDEANSRRAQEAAETSNVMDRAAFTTWLTAKLASMGRTKKKFVPPGSDMEAVIKEAIARGYVGPRYSKNSLKEDIRVYIKDRLPDSEKS